MADFASPAIEIRNLYQTYTLYSSPASMALDALGLNWIRPWRKGKEAKFDALKGISVKVAKGERVGIIGRNGAGKTTLLKLITGNYMPTTGEVTVTGKIQSLMDQGVGFHPEFTGRQNIKSALVFNGITGESAKQFESDIIDFVELGPFIDQPIKTYSLGMKARLGFAVATAVKPDILIVDEVLGAGDAYFSSKSAIRMKRLTSTGVTLLLVSHSNAQILQFCERAIWIEQGKVVADGNALEVVKQYDAFIREMESLKLGEENLSPQYSTKEMLKETYLASQQAALSRWMGSGELKIRSVRFIDLRDTERAVFSTGDCIKFLLSAEKMDGGDYSFKVVFYVFSADGRPLLLFTSDQIEFGNSSGRSMEIELRLPSIQLGTGDYVVSAALYQNLDYNDIGSSKFFDLVDRSFKFKVYNHFEADHSQFVHPGEWRIRKVQNP